MATCIQYYQSPLPHWASPYLQPGFCPAPSPAPPARKAEPLQIQQNVYAAAISKQKASRTKSEATTSTSPPTSVAPIIALTAPPPPPPPPQSPQSASPLFRLPPELRNQIYKELLSPDTLAPAQFRHHHETPNLSVRGYNSTSTDTRLHPQILATCHRIQAEAADLLYSTHTFHAHPTLLTSLPHLTSPSAPLLHTPRHLLQRIRRWQISLRLDTDPRFSADEATAAFSGAEFVEIRVWQAQFGACGVGILKLFAGVRGVGIARVGGSVGRDVAEWLERKMMMREGGGEGDEEECECECGHDGGWEVSWDGKEKEVLCGRPYKKIEGEVM